jgi:hypothetical protein
LVLVLVFQKVYRDFEVGVNYNYAEFKFDQARIQVFEAGFNTQNTGLKHLSDENYLKTLGLT